MARAAPERRRLLLPPARPRRAAGSKQGKERIMATPDRASINPGMRVRIVLKQDQRSGRLTEGIVKDILTSSASHPHGIKVRLESGEVGRVQSIAE
jgi:uncharacterized repeat protein (TIGR03833 family)